MATEHKGLPHPFGERYEDASLSKCDLSPYASKKVLDWIKEKKHMLVYLGNPGTGKTYLCASIYNFMKKNNQIRTVRPWNERKLLSRIRSEMDKHMDYLENLSLLCDDDLLVLDDVGSSGVNDWRKEVLFEFLDLRYSTMLPTIITSNLTRNEIQQKLHPRFYDRLFAEENTILEDWGKSRRGASDPPSS